MEQQFEFFAFISYKSEDEKRAKWLQRKIEGYRLPAILCKKPPYLPKKLLPTFKYTTDIRIGPLDQELERNLRNSQYLIVVCSPLSAQSKWVGKEIEYFISIGRKEQIILFIVDGEPYSNDPDKECIHPAIKKHLPEMLGANINEKGSEWKSIRREKAFIRLISTMLNVSFDSLWKRQLRLLIRKSIFWTALAILFFSSICFVWKMDQPYKAQIALREISTPSPNLKMDEAVIVIKLDNEQKTDTLSDIDSVVTFPNIPAKYKKKAINLSFSSPGFCSVDTTIVLPRDLSLPIRRDINYYGKIVGVVHSSADDRLIAGATIKVGFESSTTNENGRFEMTIPLAHQKEKYSAIVIYVRESEEQDIFPMQDNPNNSNMLYIK